ncbi:MAG: T9SS type A sorting domain-containing protein [Chitinophagaceae bacterium]|nr:T9SS type A sorting domain-containing protein [Chitinophagaceae bacterium]
MGAGTISYIKAGSNDGLQTQHAENFGSNLSTSSTTTFLQSFQTSSDPAFVGADGDVYIGNSTNIVLANTKDIRMVNDSAILASDSIIVDGKKLNLGYSIVQRTGIGIGTTFGTMFAYPQKFIVNTLIPNMLNIRNSILLPVGSISATNAQATANATGKELYVSNLPNNDPNFGKSNNDAAAFSTKATNVVGAGPSYTVYAPNNNPALNVVDTIMNLNQSIAQWTNRIADNEKTKVLAITQPNNLQNYSFTGGSPISQSYQFENHHIEDLNFSITIGAGFLLNTTIETNGIGLDININEVFTTTQGGDFVKDTGSSTNFGFTLAASPHEYLSVDVSQDKNDSSYIFVTRGGATGCPYEPGYTTQYYQQGTAIDQPTQHVEVPELSVQQAVVNNIPADKPASYTIELVNASDTKTDMAMLLYVDDISNPYGAKVSVDGTDLGLGRQIWLPYGQPVYKTLTLAKGPDSMDYNNINVVLMSTCDTTIYSSVKISAHFIPACSDINIQSPLDQWVVNTLSPVDSANSHYLPVTLTGFNVNASQFDHIELQYKPAADATWITAMQFFADNSKYTAAQGSKQMIDGSSINYNLVMNNASFSDQTYNLRAVSYCMSNGQVTATSQSDMLTGIKDTYNPRLFGSPQPANGVLDIGDNIMLTFNEAIASGLLSQADMQVTAIRNGTNGNHSVSVNLDGQSDFIKTELSKNFTGKNITVEMWILPSGTRSETQTLFSQGNINSVMEMALTADNYLQVTIGNKVITSEKALPVQAGQWVHVAFEYNAQDSTVSAFYNFSSIGVINAAPVGSYSNSGVLMFGNSLQSGNNFFSGKIHEARVWTTLIPATTLQLQSLTMLSGQENGLLAYYPMNEGTGSIIYDKARGANGKLTGTWSTPPGNAIAFAGNGYLDLNTGSVPVTSTMDYTLQLWFKAAAGQSNATLISNGKGDGTDFGGSLNMFNLGFENGILFFTNNGYKVQANGNFIDNQWHQLTISVNHVSGVAQLYIDGIMNTYFNANSVGGMVNSDTYLGARRWRDSLTNTIQTDRYFTGNIDEVRIWNTYTPQSLISNNLNTRLSGTEAGLLAYYPFEKYISFQNVQSLVSTLSDQTVQTQPIVIPDAIAANATISDDMAPIKDDGPVANLQFSYVVNNNQLMINLQEPMQAIDKTIVTMRVSNVRDLNGNPLLSPVTWTAYINQNPLQWSDDTLSFTKNVNDNFQFTSYIVNTGGSVQNFRITNLPAWLQASPSTGSVGPLGKQPITFTINPGLNVGYYDEVIYMLNDNNQSQALPLNVQVLGKDPGWTVNQGDYKYSMTIVGKIRENNIFSTNSSDKLAAFVNGQCVGVVQNTYSASNDLWYTFLTVYSNNTSSDTLSFRIWDASNGTVYQATPSTAISFSNGGIVGTTANPVIFDGKDMLIEDINLNAGWNWVSFNLNSPYITDINNLLANASWQSNDQIKGDPYSIQNNFAQYSAKDNRWETGGLTGVNNTSMFMINSANAQILSISGTIAGLSSLPITVKANRWNYISYLPSVNMTLKEGLAGYDAVSGDVIKSQTGFAMYDPQNGWVGNLTYLEPAKGYMLYRNTTTDAILLYSSLGGSLGNISATNPSSKIEAIPVNTQQLPIAANFKYANNMTLLAQVEGFNLQPTDVINAYVGGELSGKATPIHNPLTGNYSFYFNISGETNQPVYFNVERNGQAIATSASNISYVSNSSIGTPKKPYPITFDGASAKTTVYPNPFKDHTTIEVNIPNNGASTHSVQLSIFDISGKKVYEQATQQVTGNVYETVWNSSGKNEYGISQGIYIIQITIDGKQQSIKVMKQ